MDVLAKRSHDPGVPDPRHAEIPQCYMEREMEVIGVHGAIGPYCFKMSRLLSKLSIRSHKANNASLVTPSYGLLLDRT